MNKYAYKKTPQQSLKENIKGFGQTLVKKFKKFKKI